MRFSELNLNTPLLNALDDLGYDYATPIQVKAFPVISTSLPEEITGNAFT